MVRGLLGEARTRDAVLLGCAVALQLLSSFYLAYFLTLSSALLVATVCVVRRPAIADVTRLAVAVMPGYALLGLSAIPYLEKQAVAELASHYDPDFSLGIGGALAVIAPHWPHGPHGDALLNAAANYWTPWGIALLAAVALGSAFVKRSDDATATRVRIATLGLLAVVLGSFVLMIGGTLEVGDSRVPLPGKWLGAILPGFSMLRGSSRWGIVVATALPLLAALGAFAVDDALRRRGLGTLARAAASGALALAAAASFAPFRIPVVPAWPNAAAVEQRYAAVRALPEPGALLEMPWPTGAGSIDLASRAVLASTLHWRPLLNGYTGHRPTSYRFLRRIGARLPTREAVDELRRLTHLRYVLLDMELVARPELRRWDRAAHRGWLSLVHADEATRIYEVTGWQDGGEWLPALVSPEPRRTTFRGHSRATLELPPDSGRIVGPLPRQQPLRGLHEMQLRVRNGTTKDWAGFDIDERGLVRARVTYRPIGPGRKNGERRRSYTHSIPIEADFPARSTLLVRVEFQAPPRPGRYALCLDLVQRLAEPEADGTRYRALPIEPIRTNVQVTGKPLDSDLALLIERSFVPKAPPPPCGTP